MIPALNPAKSVAATVDATEEDFTTTMAAGQYFAYTANVGSWIKQGAAPLAATAASGSMFVPANTYVVIDGGYGAKLSVVSDGVDGKASLTPLV